MDLSKLTPAPWSSVAQMWGDSAVPTGKFVLAHGKTPVAIFLNEADCDAAALARNAFDVMMRRGWHSRLLPDGRGWTVDVAQCRHYGDKGMFADPFTALVEADRWYAANVEGK